MLTGRPPEYGSEQLITTRGYSIENDMFVDGELENLLHGAERRTFRVEMQAVINWYALAVSRCMAGLEQQLDLHPNELLDRNGFLEEHTRLRDAEVYPLELAEQISNDIATLLRGKTLFALLIRQLRGQTNRSLLNIAVARRGSLFNALRESVGEALLSGRGGEGHWQKNST